MSYEKHTWTLDEMITASKLNHIEEGIAGGGGALIATDNNGTLDKTWQEIYDAEFAILVGTSNGVRYYSYISSITPESIAISFFDPATKMTYNYTADSADGYPVYQPESTS